MASSQQQKQLLPSVLRMTAMELLLVGATKNRADCPHYGADELNFGAHCVCVVCEST